MRFSFLLICLLLFCVSCRKQVCVTCQQLQIAGGKVTYSRTECAEEQNVAMRRAMDAVPPDSTAVLKCRTD